MLLADGGEGGQWGEAVVPTVSYIVLTPQPAQALINTYIYKHQRAAAVPPSLFLTHPFRSTLQVKEPKRELISLGSTLPNLLGTRELGRPQKVPG